MVIQRTAVEVSSLAARLVETRRPWYRTASPGTEGTEASVGGITRAEVP